MMDLALRLTYAAAQTLWLGALAALTAAAIERLVVRSAAGRHGVHLLGLLMTGLALPVAIFLAPVEQARPLPYQLQGRGDTLVSSVPAHAGRPVMAESADAARRLGNRPAGVSRRSGDASSPALNGVGVGWEQAAPWVAGAYAVGLFGMIVRLARGVVGTARLRRRGEPVEAGVWTAALRRMGERLEVRATPALKWSREVAAPAIVGFLKPVVLLPVALASRLNPAQVEAVLAHELAHLRRGDTWVLVAQRGVETVLFFHPAVWWMSRRLEATREEACDDLALAAGCDPGDYAEALVICSEYRRERRRVAWVPAPELALTGTGGGSLRRRVLRLLGGGDEGAVRLGAAGWLLGLLLIGGAALALATGRSGRNPERDFNFAAPPSGYEQGIRMADRNQRFRVDGLTFQASPPRWEKQGWPRTPKGEPGAKDELFLNLGVSAGYEVVEIRLFDHATRRLLQDSAWQHPGASTDFWVERIGSSEWLRLQETGGTWPEKLDVWLRVATSNPGQVIALPAKANASTQAGAGELVVTSLLEGALSGRGAGPDGKMVWDLASAQSRDRMTTVNLENRGEVLRGQYHLVAVTRDGARHPMDYTHFWDFGRSGRHAYFLMDVALQDLERLELVPFKERHKFFFNGLAVPPRPARAAIGGTRAAAPAEATAGADGADDTEGRIFAAERESKATVEPRDAEARERFLAIERFARLPEAEQAARLREFYRGLPPRTVSSFVEAILSSYPHSILAGYQEQDPYDGNTDLWAQQLADAASSMDAETVADKLRHSMWLNIAARARALWVLKKHPEATADLIASDLRTRDPEAIERAATAISELKLKSFSRRLLEIWEADDELAKAAWGALVFLHDPAMLKPLLDHVEREPRFLLRCAGLFQGLLARKPAEPLLLKLLDSTDRELRYHAAYALEECTDPRLAQPVLALAREPETRCRLLAARMAARLPAPAFASVRDGLLSLLEDKDDEVRYCALLSFARKKDLAVGPVIIETLRREQLAEQHKIWAMQAVAELTGHTWNYDLHRWGPGTAGNRKAADQFETWFKNQPAAASSPFSGQAPQ